MKEIVHMRIPTDKKGKYLISQDHIINFTQITKDILKDDYILIITPFDTIKITGDQKIINIDCKEYSYDELKDIIEKANMYLTKD